MLNKNAGFFYHFLTAYSTVLYMNHKNNEFRLKVVKELIQQIAESKICNYVTYGLISRSDDNLPTCPLYFLNWLIIESVSVTV